MNAGRAVTSDEFSSRTDRSLSLVIAFVAFIGAALLLIRSSNYGLIVGPDSAVYLSVAESIAEGKGIRDYSQQNVVLFPPFYPLLLAFIYSLSIDIYSASRILNILFLGLIILLTGHCLSRYIKSRLLVVGTTVIVTTSYALNHVASQALSETSFILFTLLALIQIGAFMQEKTRKTFALSVFFTALAPITRYIGFTVIITAVILLLINQGGGGGPYIKRLRYATIHGIISSLPLAGLLIYNRSVKGSYTGDRPRASGQSLYSSLRELVDTLYAWFYSPLYESVPTPAWIRYYLWTMAGLVLLVVLIIISRRDFKQSDSKKVKKPSSITMLLPFIMFILVYIISLLITVPKAASHFDYRYLTPVYIPTIIIGSVLFAKYLSGDRNGLLLKFTLISLIASCVVYSYRAVKWNTETTVTALESKHHPPILGYTPNSPIIDYLNVNPPDSRVHTNRPYVLYHLTDIRALVKFPPRDPRENCSKYIQEQIRRWEYIIFLTRDEAFDRYRASCDFRKIATQYEYLELIVETSDGVVYRTVSPREPVSG